jgi:hypothetical protein
VAHAQGEACSRRGGGAACTPGVGQVTSRRADAGRWLARDRWRCAAACGSWRVVAWNMWCWRRARCGRACCCTRTWRT